MQLDALLAALEQTIAEELNVERLAGAGLLSRSQLYREFYSATGHSVKEYVRKRRLSKALALIKHTDATLAQIAQECGFSLPQALCKSVKSATGQTPSQYRAGGGDYYFPAYEGQPVLPVMVAAETIPPTLHLKYYDSCLKGMEERALAWLFAARPGYRGRIFGRNGKQEGTGLCYELYIEAEDADQPAVSGTFARTICRNREAEIHAAWDYLCNGWLKTSMYAQADAPYLEEYIHADGHVSRLQLFLPVQKKSGFHKIRLCHCDEMRFLAARGSGAGAEDAASQAVMDFLREHHPDLARTARQFYVANAQDNSCACGIALPPQLSLPPHCDVELITSPAGEYAVLEGDCCGNTGAYESVLSAWMGSMGLQGAAPAFAVYETDGSFGRREISATIYRAIKN